MGKKPKRRTAAERLNLLLKAPDLQSLSAVLNLLPAQVTTRLAAEMPKIVQRQEDEYRATEQEVWEKQTRAFNSYRAAIEKLIEAQAKTQDEQEKQKIHRQIAEYPYPGDTSDNAKLSLSDELTKRLTSEKNIRQSMAMLSIDSRFLPNAYEEAIDTAFMAFNLDRANPLSWRALLGFLAWTHFDDIRIKGRPPEWTPERYCLLLEHVDRIKERSPVRLSDSRACEILKTSEFKIRWKDQSAKRLDGALKEARDPWKNQALAPFVYKEGMAIKNDSVASGVEMSSEEEAALIKKLSRKHADAIGRRWRTKEAK